MIQAHILTERPFLVYHNSHDTPTSRNLACGKQVTLPAYAPIFWRSWIDFGTGPLGDMGCHILDPSFWALQLGSPASVE
ncbi:hypothetical protein LCGC14_2197070, partial [marine sediment metagenome]